jgi:hypothetical protein
MERENRRDVRTRCGKSFIWDGIGMARAKGIKG